VGVHGDKTLIITLDYKLHMEDDTLNFRIGAAAVAAALVKLL